ncbi:lytic transglycosylase domain-containing protein [Roseivivax halotolerans]|jgi:soluble lytic murein transglycosylase-like protein|nr:lytic transglycosylase domain-containing protein [Roseivivax halotolerans]
MTDMLRFALALLLGSVLSACSLPDLGSTERLQFAAAPEPVDSYNPPLHPNETEELRALINEYADYYQVPRKLVHRVVIRESTHRPWARNGPYYGLMQILPATARTMGFRGAPEDLLDAETNLKYAVKYLRGAWLLSDGDHGTAVSWYARGYYYEAKRQGMLVETGLRPG